MWKKFCVSILSVCILGGVTFISGSLFAADESALRFTENEKGHHYVNDEFSYTVASDRNDEAILFVSGGELHGGAYTYQIPFHETANITISDIHKPGAYQGELSAEVSGQRGNKEISGVLSFTVYGIVYQKDHMMMEPKQTIAPESYGTLPSDVNPIFTYTSDNEKIAVVDKEGNITALKEGITDIHMVVFDGAAEPDRRLYESVLRVEVAMNQTQPTKPQIKNGAEHDFRFIQTQPVIAESKDKQKIGYIEHPQSGTYAYQLSDKASEQYEIDNGELYVLSKQSEGKHSVKVVVHAGEQSYELVCEYEVSADNKNQKEHFQFRYEGESVSSIVRSYQEGNNSFQITSNKNLDEVLFGLKDELDAEYLNVSQTGNVIVKKISKQPIVITAKWQDEYYECSVMIDKADQEISLPSNEITVSPEDGRFDPLVEGRMGNGALVAKVTGKDQCVSLSYSEQGGLIIDPLAVGDAQIQIYNDGDANYKKSNAITLLVHVKEAKTLNKEWLGDARWLNIQGIKGQNGWYTSAVTLALKKDAPAKAFHFSDKSYDSLKWQENGEAALPIAFINSQELKSTIAKVSFKIDTHAPLITAVTERKAADRGWKQFIDELTFQSVFGEGMIIEINADDSLMNSEIKTSGVKEISYHIYRIDSDNKETLLHSGVQKGSAVSLQIADSNTHKVCAVAVDYAGNQSDELCKILDDEALTQVTAKNTSIMLHSRIFNGDEHIYVQAVDDVNIKNIAPLFPKNEEITDVTGFQIEWQNHEQAIANQVIQVTIPTVAQKLPAGYWVQKSGDTYKRLESVNKPTAQILQLTSLEPIYYVETKRSATAGQLGLYLAKPNDLIEASPSINTEVTRVSFQPFTYADTDLHMVLYGAGTVLAVCFIILLIRSGREEY